MMVKAQVHWLGFLGNNNSDWANSSSNEEFTLSAGEFKDLD